jgi:hypothetical protein
MLTQNRAARIPVLKNLHWLPVRQRIDFKILLQCYKVVHEKGPEYLSPPRRTQTRKTRSSSSITLAQKRFKTNFLPPEAKTIDAFKHFLKAWLFEITFGGLAQ